MKPEVKAGQIWRRNADGASFLVVESGKSEVTFMRREEWRTRPTFKVPAPLPHNDYTLIQDVVEVARCPSLEKEKE